MEATKPQVKAINAILAQKGMMQDKKSLIISFTNGRTDRSSKLDFEEAKELLTVLNKDFVPKVEDLRKEKMTRKVIAMAHELGWIKQIKVVSGNRIAKKRDYSSLDSWMMNFSYLKKELNKYTYQELPKLVSQFEHGPYRNYLKKI